MKPYALSPCEASALRLGPVSSGLALFHPIYASRVSDDKGAIPGWEGLSELRGKGLSHIIKLRARKRVGDWEGTRERDKVVCFNTSLSLFFPSLPLNNIYTADVNCQWLPKIPHFREESPLPPIPKLLISRPPSHRLSL